MFDIQVKQKDKYITLTWFFTKINIPLAEITRVTMDDSLLGKSKSAFRIGFPYVTAEKILISTRSASYILYTGQADLLLPKLQLYLEQSKS